VLNVDGADLTTAVGAALDMPRNGQIGWFTRHRVQEGDVLDMMTLSVLYSTDITNPTDRIRGGRVTHGVPFSCFNGVYTDAMPGPQPRPAIDRFMEKVQQMPNHWIWMAAKAPLPWDYGTFFMGRIDGRKRMKRAHVWSYEHFIGPVPDGLFVLHHCDIPSCVRPDCLFIGTQADNLADMDTKGRRGTYDHRNERNPNVKLTDLQVAEIRLRYASGGITQDRLAAEYGVNQTQISVIVRGIQRH
jgi:hypothetical protein